MAETPASGQQRSAAGAAGSAPPDRSGSGEAALSGRGSTSVEMTSAPEARTSAIGSRRPDSSVHTGQTLQTWRPDSDPRTEPMIVLDKSAPGACGETPGGAMPPRCRLGMDLGKYRITGVLGEGGMGVVYEAEDTTLRRQVAIKLLPESLSAKPEMLQRFLMEAQSAGKLDHPNVVGVFEVDRREGLHFIAMQFVRGGSAADRLKAKGALPWFEATRIIADATRGLAAAHEAGLIHRDIKPANIMLASDGPAKLADFGLAKWADRLGNSLTGADRVVGTPAYMSPEQCRAQPVDARSDVYSMGAAYFALLTGDHPYADAGATPEVMYAHCYNPVPDPTAIKADVPGACADVIRKAMAKAPADRYQTARDLLAALDALLKPGSTEIALAALPACAQPQRLRRGLIINGVLFLTAAGLLLAEMFGLTNLRGMLAPGPAPNPAPAATAEADGAIVLDVNDAELKVGVDRDEGLAAPGVGRHEHRLRPGRHLVTAEKAGVAVMREWIEIAPGQTRTVAIDGRPWVTACETLNGAAGPVWSAAFGADRTRLATAIDDGTVKLWNPQEGKVIATLRGHTGPVWTAAYTTDGKLLATGSDDGTVRLWDAEGKEGPVLKHTGPVRTLAFSQDGTRLATGCRDGTVRVWDVAAGTAVFTVPGHAGVVMSVAISRDGNTVASGSGDKTVKLWDAVSGRELVTLAGHGGGVYAVAFSPDGKTLASGGWGRAVLLWDVAAGNKKAELTGPMADVWTVAFSPDGRTLAGAGEDRRVLLWVVAAGTVKRNMVGHTGTIYSVGFSADGNVLVSAGRDGTAKLWWAGDGPKPARH